MAIDNEHIKRYLDVSGGERHKLSRFQHKPNELQKARNVDLSEQIGSATRRKGNEMVGVRIESGQPVKGLIPYFRSDGFDLLGAVDNAASTFACLRFLNYNYGWVDVITDFPAGAKMRGLNYLDKCFVVGFSRATNSYGTTTAVNRDHSIERSLDLAGAPAGKVISKLADQVYIGNVLINGKRYPNRIHRSSLPTSLITLVNGAVSGYVWRLTLDDVKYLRPGMRIDIYDPQTKSKVVDGLSIVTVDYENNIITFAGQPITVGDNFQVYQAGQKGNFRLYWNDDDFLFIPAQNNEIPEVTWIDESNNRLLIWTNKSFWKWDNANLINISPSVGCAAPDTIKRLSNGWLVWVDQSRNVWAYNDASGQFQKISRGMEPYFFASQLPISSWCATGLDDVYTLYVGPCNPLEAQITTTSTSSTSTSSTSTSTSSTSTSSTSTSSTTTSTSTSTSSTSTSTSSTSTSSTSTSTSTTAAANPTLRYRLRYFFNLNSWTVDTIQEDVTASCVHTMNGVEQIYWGDQNGQVYRQDVGNTDHGLSIPMEIETVPYDQGNPETIKEYNEIYVFTDRGQSANVFLSLDNGPWVAIGQVNELQTRIKPSAAIYKGQKLTGHQYRVKVTQNDLNDSVVYEGSSCIYVERREQ